MDNLLGTDVITGVLQKAGITGKTAEGISKMSDDEWVQFVKSLTPIQADKLKNIPFVKFGLYVNEKLETQFSQRWYFKNDYLTVPKMSQRIKIANVYNTKHDSSLEHEAVNLRLVD